MKACLTISYLLLVVATSFGQDSLDTTRFRLEIPTWKNGETTLFYGLTQQKVEQLKIDPLQSGYDSLQIRLWYDYSLINLRKLLVIYNTNNVWTAVSYTMTVDWNSYKVTETIRSKERNIVSPKGGWDQFLKAMDELLIATLPNMDDIPDLVDGWTDGISYHVEIATESQYRFYSYHLPDKFSDKFWQARYFVDFLNLVEEEFGITGGIK